MDLEVKESRNGRGIYTMRDFESDEILFEVTGPFISGDADEDIDDTVRDNAFRFSEDEYISPSGSIGDYQNHSCEPNAKVEKRDGQLFVTAIEPIKNGSEVLIDYSTIVAADDIWEMQCNCGAQSCRGFVSSFDTLPEVLKKRYIRDEIVPAYIVAITT